MKVLYDPQIFYLQKYGGVSRYFIELFRYFDRHPDVGWELILDYPHNQYVAEFGQTIRPITQYEKFFGGRDFRGKGRIFQAYQRLIPAITDRREVLRRLRGRGISVFHPTYFDNYFLEDVGTTPIVVTVYDMINEMFPNLAATSLARGHKRKLVERATKIIAISENTKKDLVRLMDVDPGKVTVIHLGSSIQRQNDVDLSSDKPGRYILYVGERGGYKNFSRLVRAIAALLRKDKTLYLVCVGGKNLNGGFLEDEERLIDLHGLTDSVLLRKANEDELVGWYSEALCLVYPSLYEGFGLPIVEAFNCSCPVVTSNTSSLPEVAGDAAEYFDPQSEESIQAAVERVLGSLVLRDELVHKGHARADRFTWSRCAIKTLQVYKELTFS